jgi:DNA recombination protein RmuC
MDGDSLLLGLAALGALNLIGLIALAIRSGRQTVDLSPLLARLDQTARDADRVESSLRAELGQNRMEVGGSLKGFGDSLNQRLDAVKAEGDLRSERLRVAVETGLAGFGDQLKRQMTDLSTGLEGKFTELSKANEARLEEMRKTVDEKLQGTLEARLGEAFAQVSERLEQVHRGLGEMQTLASGVGDLKRVLTNVKARGTWGEVQLGGLLEQILTPAQYVRNVAIDPSSSERVEFAVRLPGRDPHGPDVLLPIDAKFPQEDYIRLIEAAERADADAVEAAAKALETRARQCAADIRTKYVRPPHSTDFAIMFLPTEGLYAELLRRPGLAEALQAEHRVVPAGPTTLAALLNSLQMGFRTLAIEQRSAEVRELLGAFKTEFAKYGEVLEKVRKKLGEAQQTIDNVNVRRRAIDRKLRAVEALPSDATERLLGPAVGDADEPSEAETAD